FLVRRPVATEGYVSGLAGDGLGGQDTDWYSVQVNAGDNLVIDTTTPGGTSADGQQFINDLVPEGQLYDPSGNLVPTAIGNATDGRNVDLQYTALASGSYRVVVSGATRDSLGEYSLSVTGTTGGARDFEVVATNPPAGYVPSNPS